MIRQTTLVHRRPLWGFA